MDQAKIINQPQVSVIIPVYNTESYIEESLMSIINQTLKDIEIIVVDDGSTDKSLDVISAIALTDDRVKVVSKKNEGVSEARNAGLKKACGKYIYYMDSDDILEKEALSICFDKCETNNLDFVFFDATAFYLDINESCNDYYVRKSIVEEDKTCTGEEILNKLMDVNLYRSAVWLYLVRRQFLEKIQIHFHTGIIHEDELYTGVLHIKADRVQYISQPFFRRRIRPNSITSNEFSIKNIQCYNIVLTEFVKYAESDNRKYKPTIDKLCRYIINQATYRAASLPLKERLTQWQYCRNNNLMKYITTKNKIILLCPFLIRLKSLFK